MESWLTIIGPATGLLGIIIGQRIALSATKRARYRIQLSKDMQAITIERTQALRRILAKLGPGSNCSMSVSLLIAEDIQAMQKIMAGARDSESIAALAPRRKVLASLFDALDDLQKLLDFSSPQEVDFKQYVIMIQSAAGDPLKAATIFGDLLEATYSEPARQKLREQLAP